MSRPPGPPGMPPPPGMPMFGAPKNSSKTKGVHWKKINEHKIKETIWGQEDMEADANKLFSKDQITSFEEAFSKKPAKKPGSGGVKKPDAKPVSVLDGAREQNVGIVLKFLKMDMTQLESALLSMNLENQDFGADVVNGILSIAPKPDEIKKVQGLAEADVAKMSMAVRFFVMVAGFPRFEERLTCWLDVLEFNQNLHEIRSAVTVIKDTVEGVKTCETFKEVLKIILALGNYLNIGSAQAGAKGVMIGDLKMLVSLKAADGQTLQDWSVGFISKTNERLCEFPSDMPKLSEILSLDLEAVESNLVEIRKKMDRCTRESKQKKTKEQDGMPATLQAHVAKNEPRLREVEAEYAVTQEALRALLVYFGEPPDAGQKATDWFTSLQEFIANFATSWNTHKKKVEKAKKDAAKKARAKTEVAKPAAGAKKPVPKAEAKKPAASEPKPESEPKPDTEQKSDSTMSPKSENDEA
ncbi:Formin-like protein 13 [Diplonema papillatum]|nr:Formin-like protein 13 [Diplonema papillatum]